MHFLPRVNGREGTSYGRLARSWRPRVGWRPQMPTYQVLYPPYSELYIDVSFSWSLLLGYLILASAAGVWAVWDAGRQTTTRLRLAISRDRKSTPLNSSHGYISYAVFYFTRQ